jgi:hypothetical protein
MPHPVHLPDTGLDSVVSTATRYGLDGPGIEPRWTSDFPHPPWGPPSLVYNGYWVSFPRIQRPGAWRLSPTLI